MGDDTLEIDPDVQRRVLDNREAVGEDASKTRVPAGLCAAVLAINTAQIRNPLWLRLEGDFLFLA